MASLSALQLAYPSLPNRFLDEVNAVASRLSVEAWWLLAVMDFETGGTFDPSISNPRSSATGLIQFLESTAQNLGTSTAELAQMTRIEQLVYVERYLRPYAGRMRSVDDTYLAVFYPAAVGRSDSYVLFEQGSSAYAANDYLDANGDGLITKLEAASKVRERLRGGQTGGRGPILAGSGTAQAWVMLAVAIGLTSAFITSLLSSS